MEETWKDVIGYEGLYKVSNLGNVRSLDRPTGRKGRILTLGYGRGKYATVCLSKQGKARTTLVHHLVLDAFVGLRPEGHETRHLNGNRRDNRLTNLRWGTKSENTLDQVSMGRHRNSRKTHCNRGHLLCVGNVSEAHLKTGQRVCLSCHRARAYHKNHPLEDLAEISNRYYATFLEGVHNG